MRHGIIDKCRRLKYQGHVVISGVDVDAVIRLIRFSVLNTMATMPSCGCFCMTITSYFIWKNIGFRMLVR